MWREISKTSVQVYRITRSFVATSSLHDLKLHYESKAETTLNCLLDFNHEMLMQANAEPKITEAVQTLLKYFKCPRSELLVSTTLSETELVQEYVWEILRHITVSVVLELRKHNAWVEVHCEEDKSLFAALGYEVKPGMVTLMAALGDIIQKSQKFSVQLSQMMRTESQMGPLHSLK